MHDIYRAGIVGDEGSRGMVKYRNCSSDMKFQKSDILIRDFKVLVRKNSCSLVSTYQE